MKQNNILRISVLPLILLTAVMFMNMQPDKNSDKNNKGNNKSQGQPASKEKGQDQKQNKNDSPKNSNQNDHGNNHGKSDNQQKNSNNKKNNNANDNKSNGHAGASNGNGNKSNGEGNKWNRNGNKSNGNSKMLNGKRDMDIDWNFGNFADRKHPKNQKKVTICHNPSNDRSNGVTISISENALQAHINHGDEIGDCNLDYSDRWSSSYVKSRENVYNTYEQAWETMSYSEILLKVAMEKLLGIQTNLNSTRSTLTTNDIQRREALIYDLQNNVNSLENQLGSTRQTLDSDVNILITL